MHKDKIIKLIDKDGVVVVENFLSKNRCTFYLNKILKILEKKLRTMNILGIQIIK